MTNSLMEQTRLLLRNCGRSLPEVYGDLRMAGIEDISYFWLRKFSSGAFRNPSVNKVQALYEHLSGKQLVA